MKALGLFLGALLAISLAGCGDGGSGNTGGSTGGTGGATGGTGGATGGTGGATGGTGGATGGAGGTTSNLSCDAYCAEIATNCAGDQQQYVDTDGCMGVCATFDPGTIDDKSGATLGCHLYHGGVPAAGDPATHCAHAGPLGGGSCGNDCDNFCEIAVAVCGSQATPPYADVAACKTACEGFADTTAVPYSAKVNSGDSLACRMYHLSVAASSVDAATTHCPHVAAVSSQCN